MTGDSVLNYHSRDLAAEMALSSFGISLFLLLGHLCQSFSQSSPNVSYKVAVVEFTPEQVANIGNVVKNLLALENLAAEAQKEKVNIIMFPEHVITGYNYSNRFAIRIFILGDTSTHSQTRCDHYSLW